MGEIRNIDTVHQYNSFMGVETLHPLVSVIDFSLCKPRTFTRKNYGLYCIFLKELKCGELRYGRSSYDYQDGTIVAIAPGQIFGAESNGVMLQPKGWALVFHPDLIYGTELGRTIREYSFFSYDANEALHLSEKEREIIVDCMKNIFAELNREVDKHTNRLGTKNIRLLLDYCRRFYDRQFITRDKENKDILTRFENLLDDYFKKGKAQAQGLPSVSFCADNLYLSSNYFGDLIKRETGKTAQEYIQLRVIDIAKEKMCGSELSISEIAYQLGFKYPTHFTRLFKKCAGMSPSKYRVRI